jgi:hypothetical protein
VDGEKLKKQVGLWIDHRKAVIVSINGEIEEIKSITSDMEKHVRYSGGARNDSEEDERDRRFIGHLNKYYDEITALIKDATAVLIIGPGEAKVEFKKRLEIEKQIGRVIDIETTDKMTDPQIAAKVRDHFLDKVSQS